MKRWVSLGAAAAAVGAGAVMLVIGFAHQPAAATSQTTNASVPVSTGIFVPKRGGGPAPALVGVTLETHQPVTLAAYRGRAVIVSFFASWCDPCRQEAPALRRFAASHPSVQLVGVAFEDQSTSAVAFAKREGWTWPLLADASGSIAATWRVGAIPTTFLIDRGGRIVETKFGATTSSDLEQMIKAA
jgi:cytochrome c biogenesis protein CcmG, thiol:disulfide interchange protein DsbE